jgi:hypothetical protein
MANLSKPLVTTLDFPNAGFAEIRTDVITDDRSLFAKRAFNKNVVISDFYWVEVYDKPNRLTVQVGEHQHIELLPTYLECINHSCDPNAFFDVQNKQLICIRPINKDEEITFFYPSTEWEMDAPFNCCCNSQYCVGYIAGAKYLTIKQQKRYRFTDLIQLKLPK